MKKPLILLLVLALVSCKSSLIKKYEITQPKPETEQSIQQFLDKNMVSKNNDATFQDMNAFVIGKKQGYLRVPNAIFFNSDGYYVPFSKSASECNAGVDTFIEDLSDFRNQEFNQDITINKFTSLLSNPTIASNSKADITVFITWTIYSGKLNEEKAFLWLQLLEDAKAKGINVDYYLINCDLQASWDLSEYDLNFN